MTYRLLHWPTLGPPLHSFVWSCNYLTVKVCWRRNHLSVNGTPASAAMGIIFNGLYYFVQYISWTPFISRVYEPMCCRSSRFFEHENVFAFLLPIYLISDNQIFSAADACGVTLWRIWLWQCAATRKVAGSIPDGVTGTFHWQKSSGCTMILRLTQPLTEMSTRNISWG
jgi:hypothetical protein